MTVETDFTVWMWQHYRLGPTPAGGKPPKIECIRCGKEVDWLTRHAVERHGDQVTVIPPVHDAPEGGWRW